MQLPAATSRPQALLSMVGLARRYVLELGRDDIFFLHGRLQADAVRRVDWTPADGTEKLAAMLDDYAEYFEGIEFPSLDAGRVPSEAAKDQVYLHGVGLDVVNVQGTDWTARRMEHLVHEKESVPSMQSTQPRERRMALYHSTWPPRQASAIRSALQQGIGDAVAEVRAAAASVAGRCRALPLAEPLRGLLADADAGVRAAAIRGLNQIDETAAVSWCAHCLADADTSVRQAAFAAMRHLQHMPWARRKEIMSEVSSQLGPALSYLDGEQADRLLEWLAGSGGEAALRVVEVLGLHPNVAVGCKAVRIAVTLEGVDILPILVNLLEQGSEPLRTEVVCVLQRDDYRGALQQRPPLKSRVMQVLHSLTESEN